MYKRLTKISLQQYGMLYYYNISLFLPEVSLLKLSVVVLFAHRKVMRI